MSSLHLRERIALRVTDAQVQDHIINRCDRYASSLDTHTTHAVYVTRAACHIGDDDPDYYSRSASNGTLGVVIIRDGTPVTFMWRRDNQPATPDALRVHKVWHAKGV